MTTFGERQIDLYRRRLAWDQAVPFGSGVAGVAGLMASSSGWAVMLPVMAAVFVVVAVAGRVMWADVERASGESR